MKRVLLRTAFLTACLMMLGTGALAKEGIKEGTKTGANDEAREALRVYAAEGAMEAEEAKRLTALLKETFPQADFVLVEGTEPLRTLVLADNAPDIAVCSPRETRVWAGEGLTLPLQRHIGGQEELANEILSLCVLDEALFMAPLRARHRQMAVNVKRLEKQAMGYMLDEIAHPVWYPTEFQQILEEFAIGGAPALDIWPMQTQDCAGIEALIQAIYCGFLLEESGTVCTADGKAVHAGMRWLRELAASDMIGRCASRQEALDRFLAGETAIFLDWTMQMQETYARRIKEAGLTVEMRPYPSSCGLPVRSYEVTGVSVFDSGDNKRNALALEAAAFLAGDDRVQAILGERGIYEDGSVFLWDLSASDRGATLRSLMCTAVNRVLEGKEEIAQALEMVKTGMNASK